MPRELRKRASRINYAELLRFEDEDEDDAGPSKPAPAFEDEGDSGSDFAPEAAIEGEEDAEADDDENLSDAGIDDDTHSTSDREFSIAAAHSVKSTSAAARRSVTLAPGITMSRQIMNSQIPSLHHRHRAIPLYHRQSAVERLKEAPRLFTQPELQSTKAWSLNGIVSGRVSKAWGYNVGPGPLWELLEDRAWFKEAGSDDESESVRRPRVHQNIAGTDGLQRISPEEAIPYLPENITTKCFFGPLGDQRMIETVCFDVLDMGTFFLESKSFAFNAGAPVWGLDWCPIHPEDRPNISFRQYLAVGPSRSHTHSPAIGVKATRPMPGCIQIWSFGPAAPGQSEGNDKGTMKCEMVLCIDSGPAHELKWCPLPSHDQLDSKRRQDSPRTLGLLAGTFQDGSLSIYSVPFPEDVRDQNKVGPVFLKLPRPLLRFEIEDGSCWCLDWANSEIIATGCTNGAIAVWNIKKALCLQRSHPSLPIPPTHYFSTHQCAIRSVAWIRAPTHSTHAKMSRDDPTVIVGSGYDGLLSACDVREPYGNEVYRTRDVINTVCYSTYSGGPVSVDQGQVKVISFAPVMLNKGHTLLDPDGPAWSMHASDYHPQLAVGVTDGSCITTNTLRTTRRGGSVPFLMHKIYQMDYSRKTGEFRMLEHILPKEIDRTAGVKAVKPATKGSGVWPPEVGVQRVVWNNGNGLANASLLASATGSGLCRVDWLSGKWLKDRVPYYGIEGIRNERDSDGEMDENSD